MATNAKPKMKLKKGDHVQVIQGKDVGKRGEVEVKSVRNP